VYRSFLVTPFSASRSVVICGDLWPGPVRLPTCGHLWNRLASRGSARAGGVFAVFSNVCAGDICVGPLGTDSPSRYFATAATNPSGIGAQVSGETVADSGYPGASTSTTGTGRFERLSRSIAHRRPRSPRPQRYHGRHQDPHRAVSEGDETAGRHRAIVAWREPIPGLVDRRRRQGYLFVGH